MSTPVSPFLCVVTTHHPPPTLHRLKYIVSSLLGYSIDVENAACLLQVAVLYNAWVLERACASFIILHAKSVARTEAWRELPRETKEYLKQKAIEWGFLRGGGSGKQGDHQHVDDAAEQAKINSATQLWK